MKKLYTPIYFLLLNLFLATAVQAQNNFFTDAGNNANFPASNGLRVLFPSNYRAASLDVQGVQRFLWSLPMEASVRSNFRNAPVMELPMPDGRMARFHVWESPIMEPGLAAKFPEIKTFAGQGIDDPYATVRMAYNPYFGFTAQVLSVVSGRILIDAYARWDVKNYISYFSRDNTAVSAFHCDIPENPQPDIPLAGPCLGTDLRTYRLAQACTGEYAIAVCNPAPPTVAGTMAEITNAVNRVSGVYETEVAVRLSLIANNNLIVYLDPATDPYTNNNGGAMLGQNQTTCDNVIGTGNYDIGHVFSTGGGGVASLSVICRAGLKARGVTGLPNPIGDPFYIDYVAHEMGHQYGGNHTFNSVTGSCSGNRAAGAAYEVGSATTIMGYAGICGSDNIQPNSDPFFHTVSFDEIGNYITGPFGNSCPVLTATGNSLPVITAMNNNGASIPLNTPFTLTATATDANGDPLTYCWEEWDLGPAGTWNSGATSTTAPLFKSRIPKTTGARTFPDIAVILAGYPANPAATMGGLKGETLPQVARTIKFRLTVRDNRPGGSGVVTGGDGCQSGFTSTFSITTVAGTGPFLVSTPNGGETFIGGTSQTITWDPAGTAAAPISTANVKISLSTDGGLTYPTVLTASTANDGTENVIFPCVTSTTARIKVEAVGNIFFDISDANFTIANGFDFDSPAPVTAACPVPASLSITLGTSAPCGFANNINLSASGNPPGTTVTFSPNPVAPGSSTTVTLNNTASLAPGTYNITITGNAAGAPVRTRIITFIVTTPASPTITAQPASQTICAGSNVTFNVTATNASAYQWQISTGGGPFTDITGANASSYTVTGATSGMNGNQYRVIVSNSCAVSTTSSAATLTVINPVTISAQPVNKELCAGGTTSFTVTANSSQPVSYQWQVSPDGISWTNINNGGIYSGANTATLTITGATTSINGNRYRVLVSNTTCTTPVPSNAAQLNVHDLPTIGLSASPLTSLLPGQTTVLTATPGPSSGGIITTSWLYNSNPLAVVGNTYVVNVETVGTYQVLIQETWPGNVVCVNQSPQVVIGATVSDKLFIFPSPNDGRFTVSYYNASGAAAQRRIVIMSAKGEKVYDRQFPINGPYSLLKIDLRNASRGIYFVLVGDASGKRLVEGKVHVR
jgi:hypothetical protein